MNKNLIQYVYPCSNAIFRFLKDNDKPKLIKSLRKCETHYKERNEYGEDCSLWFKFGHDDTLCTTISDIDNEKNIKYFLDKFKLVVSDMNECNEIRVYFS